MLGWSCSSAEDVLGRGDKWDDWPPAGSNRFNQQSRWRGSTGGCNTQRGWGRRRGEHNNYFALEPGANSRPSTACLAPKHNNKQQPSSFVVVNERMTRPFAMNMQNKQQSAKEGGGICCKFDCCLVSISFYSYNTYFKPKLHQQNSYYVCY
jgi:hypothetical protein